MYFPDWTHGQKWKQFLNNSCSCNSFILPILLLCTSDEGHACINYKMYDSTQWDLHYMNTCVPVKSQIKSVQGKR